MQTAVSLHSTSRMIIRWKNNKTMAHIQWSSMHKVNVTAVLQSFGNKWTPTSKEQSTVSTIHAPFKNTYSMHAWMLYCPNTFANNASMPVSWAKKHQGMQTVSQNDEMRETVICMRTEHPIRLAFYKIMRKIVMQLTIHARQIIFHEAWTSHLSQVHSIVYNNDRTKQLVADKII